MPKIDEFRTNLLKIVTEALELTSKNLIEESDDSPTHASDLLLAVTEGSSAIRAAILAQERDQLIEPGVHRDSVRRMTVCIREMCEKVVRTYG